MVLPRAGFHLGSLEQEIERSLALRRGIQVMRWAVVRDHLIAGLPHASDVIGGVLSRARQIYLEQQFEEMERMLLTAEQQHLPALIETGRGPILNFLLGVALAAQQRPAPAILRFQLAQRLAASGT